MQYRDRIEAIEARAARLNLTLWRLCRDAGVDYSTLHRWKSDETSPNVATLERVLGQLERMLDELEDKMRKALGVPPVADAASPRPAA